jgi:hypothetical protein
MERAGERPANERCRWRPFDGAGRKDDLAPASSKRPASGIFPGPGRPHSPCLSRGKADPLSSRFPARWQRPSRELVR